MLGERGISKEAESTSCCGLSSSFTSTLQPSLNTSDRCVAVPTLDCRIHSCDVEAIYPSSVSAFACETLGSADLKPPDCMSPATLSYFAADTSHLRGDK